MPTRFDLPTLSTKDYATLVDELTAAIPKYSDNWTDRNMSDPGMTLLQLLAWLGDASLYRIDAVPTELYLNFAHWLLGASGEAIDLLVRDLERDILRDDRGRAIYLGGAVVVYDPKRLDLAVYLHALASGTQVDLDVLRKRTVDYWRSPYRAVTLLDFEQLAAEVTASVAPEAIHDKIALVVVRIEGPFIEVFPVVAFQFDYDTILTAPSMPGLPLMSLAASIKSGTMHYAASKAKALADAVRLYLEPRRILGTPVDVRPPTFNPVTLSIRVAALALADPASVLSRLLAALRSMLSPIDGGGDGKGWPHGRALTAYDVQTIAASVPGVDLTQPIDVDAQTLPGLLVGTSLLGVTSLIGSGYALGFPQLWKVDLVACATTWPFTLGVHARLGLDTMLPRSA